MIGLVALAHDIEYRCRHLKIAGRIAFFMISSGYRPRRPKLQHNLSEPSHRGV